MKILALIDEDFLASIEQKCEYDWSFEPDSCQVFYDNQMLLIYSMLFYCLNNFLDVTLFSWFFKSSSKTHQADSVDIQRVKSKVA